jgi:tape measure domain-containing protein
MSNDLAKFQSNASRTAKNIDKSFANLGSGIKGAFGGITAALSLRELGQMADSFTNIQARLKLATRDANEFAEASDNIKRIASSSKSSLESTATLYTRISNTLLDIGGTQAQVADTTQALALGLKLSGATAEESASAMLQFSQAIGSGVLRGEEFNAINEAAPRIMKALADSIGVPVGQLRKLAEEGKITRDILVNSLGSQLPTLIKEAETLPNTIGAAFQNAKNEILLTVGAIDKATGASNAFAKAVGAVAQGIAGWRNFFNPTDDQKIGVLTP